MAAWTDFSHICTTELSALEQFCEEQKKVINVSIYSTENNENGSILALKAEFPIIAHTLLETSKASDLLPADKVLTGQNYASLA